MQPIQALLSQHPLFEGADPRVTEEIISEGRTIRCAAGRFILRENKPARHVYALLEGGVRVFHLGPAGEEIVVKLFAAPALFGEADVLAEVPWAQSAQTVMPSVILELPAATFRRLLRKEPSFAEALAVDLAKRLLVTSDQLRHSLTETAESRLASFILDYASIFGLPVEGGTAIQPALSHSSIARSLALSRKTVQRVLGSWIDEGWLSRSGRRYVLRKEAPLVALTASGRIGIAYRSARSVVAPE